MAGDATALNPALNYYVSVMHGAAIVLALAVPFVRLCWKKYLKMHYSSGEAVHDGISAAALPSLFAMMMAFTTPSILSHINVFEFFAAGLLGIIQTIAQLFTHSAHGPGHGSAKPGG